MKRAWIQWMAVPVSVMGLTTQPGWAGEYFTEEVTSPSIEVVHGWVGSAADRQVTVTSTSRGGINVPLEISGIGCGQIEMELTSGLTQPLGTMEDCTINLFPFLDKLINQEIALLRVAITTSDDVLEIPLSDSDRLILARVGNQSRESFVFFQRELARVLDLFRQASNTSTPTLPPSTPAPPSPVPTPVFSPSPPPPTPATPQASDPDAEGGELIIVGQIREEREGAASLLTVEAINPTEFTVLSARAIFRFFQGDQLVDTLEAGFQPSDVPPRQRALAQVRKTDPNWERVTVSFEWQRPPSQ